MEWVNGAGKRGGGIVGITKTASALSRWTLSFNLRSHIAERTHQLYRLPHGSTDHHNEVTKSRQTRDNDDENSLLTTLRGTMSSHLHQIQTGCKTLPQKTSRQS